MKDCKRCLAFEERKSLSESFVRKEKGGHYKPYCDMYGMFLKDTNAPCEKRGFLESPSK